jgi:hypothetical protein
MAGSHAAPRIQVERLEGGVVLARLAGHDLGLIGRDEAAELVELVARADRDPSTRAVVFTGTRAGRFVSHADLAWLQADGAVIPPLGRRITGVVAHIAHLLGRFRLTRWLARKTVLTGAIQLDEVHGALVRMTTSSTIFVAALNGSVLGLGASSRGPVTCA